MYALVWLLTLQACGNGQTEGHSATGSSTDTTVGKQPVLELDSAEVPLPKSDILLLDDPHNALWTDTSYAYLLLPTSTVRLDVAQYAFRIPGSVHSESVMKKLGVEEKITAPNLLQVQYDGVGYNITWAPDSAGMMTVGIPEMMAAVRNTPFVEFKNGKEARFVVGFQGLKTEANGLRPFVPFYACRVIFSSDAKIQLKKGQSLPTIPEKHPGNAGPR